MGEDKPKVVDTVEKTLKAGGEHATQDAYKALKDDFDEYAKTHQSAADQKAYLDQVTAALDKSVPGALPKMALEWANQNVGDTFLTAGKGRWEKNMLEGVANPNDRALKSGFVNTLDQAMAGQVLKQWDSLKEDDNGWWFGGTDVITRDRLNDRLKNVNNDLSFERVQRDDREQIKPYIAQLMRSSDGSGNDSLFNVMDELPGGKKDGKINKADFERFRSEYDRHYDDAHPGKPPWNKENRDLVDKIIQGWDDPKNPNHQLAQMVRGSVATKEDSHFIPVPSEYPVSVENRKNNGVNYTESDEFVTADSLRRALGAEKDANLYDQFKGQPEAPKPTDNTNGQTEQPQGNAQGLDRENSRKVINLLASMPSDLQSSGSGKGSVLFPDGKMTKASVDDALQKSKELSNQDRAFLEGLSKNWPQGVDGVGLEQLQKSGELTDKNQFDAFLLIENASATGVVDGLHKTVSADMVQDKDGNITKESVQAAIDKRRQELSGGPPGEDTTGDDARLRALTGLYQQFDDIARDGRKNITEDDLKVYAKNHIHYEGPSGDGTQEAPGPNGRPMSWEGFAKKEDLDKPAQPTDNGLDKQKAQAMLDAVHGNVSRADIPGDITPANIDKAIETARGKYGEDGETHADDPKIAALQALKDNYATISGGKDKIDENDIKSFAEQNGLKWEGFAAAAAPTENPDQPPAPTDEVQFRDQPHTVGPGDTLTKLSRKYGVSIEDIYNDNKELWEQRFKDKPQYKKYMTPPGAYDFILDGWQLKIRKPAGQ